MYVSHILTWHIICIFVSYKWIFEFFLSIIRIQALVINIYNFVFAIVVLQSTVSVIYQLLIIFFNQCLHVVLLHRITKVPQNYYATVSKKAKSGPVHH